MESIPCNENLQSLASPGFNGIKANSQEPDETFCQVARHSEPSNNKLPCTEELTSGQSMELPRDNTESRSGFILSRAIYGGHISGRRLHGVKINPIYQENNGDFWDKQSNTNTPANETQIKTYESLPRHFLRGSSSAPNIHYVCSTSMSRIPYVCNGRMAHLGDIKPNDTTLSFSHFSLPNLSEDDSVNNEGSDVQTDSGAGDHFRPSDQYHPWSWPQTDRGYKKQLIRQQGIDVTSEDMRNTEKVKSTISTSSPSRRPASSTSSSQHYHIKRRRIPRILNKETFLRKTRLSVLREQSTSTENEQSGVSENEQSGVSENEQNEVSDSGPNDVDENDCRLSDTNFKTHLADDDDSDCLISGHGKNGKEKRQGF
ncbi:hypothetical protein BsWGS_04686 [Bradybaena similaris]